jgi:hypothetical protein
VTGRGFRSISCRWWYDRLPFWKRAAHAIGIDERIAKRSGDGERHDGVNPANLAAHDGGEFPAELGFEAGE